jgi:hypothetical protein
VWDLNTNLETRGRYQGETQTLFAAEVTSVNHPDIAWFDGAFTAVSQWYWAIGRTSFTSLPAALEIAADWDAGEGGSEHKAPSIAANRDGDTWRLAWASYHGDRIYLKTLLSGEAVPTDLDFQAAEIEVEGIPLQGYAGWPRVAVDADLGIHLAWHDWVASGDEREFRAVDYRHLPHPGLQPALSTLLDVPLGDVGSVSPAVAVGDAGDVVVTFGSNLPSGGSVYFCLREAGQSDFPGGAVPLEEDRMGSPYTPAAAPWGERFWLLYNGKQGDQVHAVLLRRAP